MPIDEYVVKRDKFEPEPNGSNFQFPCCVCAHRYGLDTEEPCRTCDHSATAVPEDGDYVSFEAWDGRVA